MANLVSTQEALEHLRLPTDDVTTPEYLEVERMVGAATEWCENYCKRAFTQGTKTKTFTYFPSYTLNKTEQALPLTGGVVDSVTSLTYYDTDFVQQTFADWRLVVTHGASYLYPAMDESWPTDNSCEPYAIAVTYVVGEASLSDVPDSVKQAALLIVGSLYEYREEGVIDNSGVALVSAPVAAERLLHPYKMRFH